MHVLVRKPKRERERGKNLEDLDIDGRIIIIILLLKWTLVSDLVVWLVS